MVRFSPSSALQPSKKNLRKKKKSWYFLKVKGRFLNPHTNYCCFSPYFLPRMCWCRYLLCWLITFYSQNWHLVIHHIGCLQYPMPRSIAERCYNKTLVFIRAVLYPVTWPVMKVCCWWLGRHYCIALGTLGTLYSVVMEGTVLTALWFRHRVKIILF